MRKMTAAQTDYSIGQDRSFETEIVLDAPGESEWIIIPEKVTGISITVNFSNGGSGKIQTTTDTVDVIRNGTPFAIDWPWGQICCNETHRCNPCSGIKVIQIDTGNMRVTIRAQ